MKKHEADSRKYCTAGVTSLLAGNRGDMLASEVTVPSTPTDSAPVYSLAIAILLFAAAFIRSRVAQTVHACLLLVFVAAITACGGGSSGSGTTTFAKSFGAEARESARAAIPNGNGGYLFVGSHNKRFQSGGRATGFWREFVWGDRALDGNIWAVNLDANGNLLWQQSIGAPPLIPTGGELGKPRYLAAYPAADGGTWLTGYVPVGSVSDANGRYHERATDLLVTRLDASGNVVWSRRYDSGDYPGYEYYFSDESTSERGRAIQPARDGSGVLVAARAQAYVDADPGANAKSGKLGEFIYLLKLDAANGDPVWEQRYTGWQFEAPVEAEDEWLLLNPTTDGGALVVFSKLLSDNQIADATFLRVDAGGQVPWSYTIDDNRIYQAIQVDDDLDGVSDDGFVLVAQSKYRVDGPIGFIYKVSAGGLIEWYDDLPDRSLHAVAERCIINAENSLRCQYAVLGKNQSGRLTARYYSVDGTDIYGVSTFENIPIRGVSRLRYLAGSDGFQALIDKRDSGERVLLNLQNAFGFQGTVPLAGQITAKLTPNREFIPLADGWLQLTLLNSPIVSRWSADGSLNQSVSLPVIARQLQDAHQVLADGNGYIINATVADGGTARYSADALLIRLRSDGRIDWQRRINGFTPSTQGLVVRAGGGYALAGSAIAQDWDGVVLLDSNGNITGYSDDYSNFLDPDSGRNIYYPAVLTRATDGDLLIAGATDLYGGSIARLTETGQLRWFQRYSSFAAVASLVAGEDGSIYAAGNGSDHDIKIMKLDRNGQVIWAKKYKHGLDRIRGARLALNDKGLLIAATNRPGELAYTPRPCINDDGSIDLSCVNASLATNEAKFGRGNVLLLNIDLAGEVLWSKLYGGLFDEIAHGVTALADGGFLVAAESESMGDYSDAWLLRLDANGDIAQGCNALLGNTTVVGQDLSVQASDATLASEQTASLESRLVEYPVNTTGEPVIARQCLGSAGSANPPAQGSINLQLDVQGAGIVRSAPAGLLCGNLGAPVCGATFPSGASVLLTAEPDSAAIFDGWNPDDCISQPTPEQCLVDTSSDRFISTQFFAPAELIRVNVTVEGAGRINASEGAIGSCAIGDTCSGFYRPSIVLDLTPAPDAGQQFIGWSGPCNGDFLDMRLYFDQVFCTARFTNLGRVSITKQGLGRVTSTPAGIDCGQNTLVGCDAPFDNGSQVTLTAIPDAGRAFDQWRCSVNGSLVGDPRLPVTSEQLTFTMNGQHQCEARFFDTQRRLSLTITDVNRPGLTGDHELRILSVPDPSECRQDCDRLYTAGANISLTVAMARDAGPIVFSNPVWSGCDALTLGLYAQVCHVNMNTNRQVSFSYESNSIGGGPNLTVPIAAFSYSPASPVAGAPVTLDASASTDGLGITTYHWDVNNDGIVDITTANPVTTYTYTTPGDYRVHLRVFDSSGNIDDAGATIQVGSGIPPVAAFSYLPAAPQALVSISFDASASSDDQSLASLVWDFDGDGVFEESGALVFRTYNIAGSYPVTLRAVDNEGLTNEVTQTVVVAPSNPPTAVMLINPMLIIAGDNVNFNAALSSDDGGVTSYQWDFEDDGVFDATGVTASFIYTSAGSYTARLRVTDADGQTADATSSFQVVNSPAGNTLTVIQAGSAIGTVQSSPSGINCNSDPANCTASFPAGAQVLLNPVPPAGVALTRWEGCDQVVDAVICLVTVNGDRTVQAFFD